MTPNDFDTALQSYIETAQRISQEHRDKHWPNAPLYEWNVERLKRYVRVVKDASVHSFIDISNGDILKPAGYTKPAKHPRGNIFTPDHGASALDWHGPKYLR